MDNNLNGDALHHEVAQLIDGLFQDFVNAGLVVESQYVYDQVIARLIDEIFEGFKNRYRRIKNSQKFKNVFLSVVRTKQDDLFNDKNYLTVFNDVKDINDDADINQPYVEAILIFCERCRIEDSNDVINYLIRLEALLQVFHKINNCKLTDLDQE